MIHSAPKKTNIDTGYLNGEKEKVSYTKPSKHFQNTMASQSYVSIAKTIQPHLTSTNNAATESFLTTNRPPLSAQNFPVVPRVLWETQSQQPF